jgi:signal transduction histidine kinase
MIAPMNGEVDNFDRVAPTSATEDMWHYLLSVVASNVPCDRVCLFAYSSDLNALEHVASYAGTDSPVEFSDALYARLTSYIHQLEPVSAPFILDSEAEETETFSALLFPFTMPDRVMGALFLLSHQRHLYTAEAIGKLQPCARFAQAMLENMHLSADLATARALLTTAHAIAENPSPQSVVAALRDHLFSEAVSSCGILLYGPIREDRPFGPFEYIEVKAGWSRQFGMEFGVGIRLYLETVGGILSQVTQQKTFIFNDIEEVFPMIDPFVRGLIQSQQIRSVAVLRLDAGERPLGLIAITSQHTNAFSPDELRSYRVVSEFLTISTMAQVLQHQHDLVQQARAALLDAVTDGVVMAVPDKDEARVLTVNRRFTEMFGLQEADVSGTLLSELLEKMQVPVAVRRDLYKTWSSIPVRDPSSQEGEFSMTSMRGVPSDIQWHSAPVYQGKGVIGRVYTFHDVTPERVGERLRTGLLMRHSHELRTPLTSISGFAELILDSSGDALPDLAREYIESIYKSAKHLNRLFSDMILLARANMGELELQLQEAHLPDIIIEAVARLEPQYKARHQTVLLALDDNLPHVYVDNDRILQVVTNLVNNSIKHAPEGSKIRISTFYLEAEKDLPENAPPDVPLPSILVMVDDEGAGLSKDDIENVFLPFYRTEGAQAAKIEGVGMGLAFSHSIIDLHRGKIWAIPRSRKQRGGCFLFVLPILQT